MRACPECLSIFVRAAEHCSVDGARLVDPENLTGRNIDGFTIETLIGEGGTGAVFQGVNDRGDPVALKILYQEMLLTHGTAERFRREAETIREISHQNVVAIQQFGSTAAGSFYLAMELIEGRTLKEVLVSEAPLEPDRAARIAEQICAGLGEAHRLGFIHRDLKPGNVLLTGYGRAESVKLVDFGIVANLREQSSDHRLTKTGHIVGTPIYMAPEQVDPTGVGTEADVYALGIILYEMLAGAPPFEGTLEQILVAKITGDPPKLDGGPLASLVQRLLARDPRNRPRDALQVLREMERANLRTDIGPTELSQPAEHPTYLEASGSSPTLLTNEAATDELPNEVTDDQSPDEADTNIEWRADTFQAASVSEPKDTVVGGWTADTMIDGVPSAMRGDSAPAFRPEQLGPSLVAADQPSVDLPATAITPAPGSQRAGETRPIFAPPDGETEPADVADTHEGDALTPGGGVQVKTSGASPIAPLLLFIAGLATIILVGMLLLWVFRPETVILDVPLTLPK